MRTENFRRSTRRYIGVALSAALAASVAVGISTRGGTSDAQKPAAKPEEMSITAALASFAGSSTYFLKVPGIAGESTEAKHPGEIDIQSVSWGLTRAGTAGGAGVAKPVFDNVVITKLLDASSPFLMKAVANGQTFSTVTVYAKKSSASAVEYFQLILYNATATSFKEAGDDTLLLHDTVGFNFTKIRLAVVKQDPKTGSTTQLSQCWDLGTNVAC